ncbi:MAG: AAA family ATPase [Methyloprofundus sp.]|nr:AAA family ATPase [Methyloprofundus sp.]MBW6453122.1 AAA family ATPase [Methyloprofundus sp.]
MKLKEITVKGYKSIKSLEKFSLNNMNVLIGANGVGKSNLIGLFKMLGALAEGDLQLHIKGSGGPDAILHGGRKRTKTMEAEFYFGDNGYRIALSATQDNRMMFLKEETWFNGNYGIHIESLGNAHEEAKLRIKPTTASEYVLPAIKSWRLYHFHDTSAEAKVKQLHPNNQNIKLNSDAGNLAAYIAKLKLSFPDAYQRIVETIRLAAPFFDDFVVRDPLPQDVELEWIEQGDPDTPYRAHVLSDGTLRFICLTVLLLQPIHLLPDTIIIDEPELGLHPYAINLLADMLQEVAEKKQLIVATQSVELLNNFEAKDVVIVQREKGASIFERLDEEDLAEWLEEFSLGDLWKRNILGGRPAI